MPSSFSEANFWWTHLKNYLITGKNLTDWREAFEVGEEGEGDSEAFSGYLSDFLFTPEGGVSTNNFRWANGSELVCGEPAPIITVSGCHMLASKVPFILEIKALKKVPVNT